jgi:prevent-host-death family protein
MSKTYSTYEAKARLSELLKRVTKGDVVTITHRGEPIAEIRQAARLADDLAARLDALRRSGIISPRKSEPTWKPLAKRKGALGRFLDSRE